MAVKSLAPQPRLKTFPREVRGTADPSTSVGMTKGTVALPFEFDAADDEQQVPPLRYASVGMTLLLGMDKRVSGSSFVWLLRPMEAPPLLLSSRPKRRDLLFSSPAGWRSRLPSDDQDKFVPDLLHGSAVLQRRGLPRARWAQRKQGGARARSVAMQCAPRWDGMHR
jgi:hypothetical protein